MSRGRWENGASPSLWTSLLPAELSVLWTTGKEPDMSVWGRAQQMYYKQDEHETTFTFAARMEMIATAILCMFWSSWLQSHCITSLAASNLTYINIWFQSIVWTVTVLLHLSSLFLHVHLKNCMNNKNSTKYHNISHLLNGTSCKMRSLQRDSRQFFCSYKQKPKQASD